MKLVLLGNAGAGKSTMARRLIGGRQIPRLSLDEIAWDPGPQRKPLHESLELLNDFLKTNDQWVIEGCYSDLVEAALGQCTELRFLNPGMRSALPTATGGLGSLKNFPRRSSRTQCLSNWSYGLSNTRFGMTSMA